MNFEKPLEYLKLTNTIISSYNPKSTNKKKIVTDERRYSEIEFFQKYFLHPDPLLQNLCRACKIDLKDGDYPETVEDLKKILPDIVVAMGGDSNRSHNSDKDMVDRYAGCSLYYNLRAEDDKEFLIVKGDVIFPDRPEVFMALKGLKNPDLSVEEITKAFFEYMPRNKPGLSVAKVGGIDSQVFNTYSRPKWMDFEGKLPDCLPNEVEKLIKHLLPLKIEREYLFYWWRKSLVDRAPVYLVLCGAPGIGKNRLKNLMRATHGHSNSVDGKRSTFTDKFNSQLADCTLNWCDELSYNSEMENFLKEIQNDTISIERKGVDSTRQTRIFASSVISNNRPRDNAITSESRKFSPLNLSEHRLETSMTPKEIDILTRKTEKENSEEYDLSYIAQIGRWILKHGHSDKFPNCEYRGPMFYKLCHTSMTRWQRQYLLAIINGQNSDSRIANYFEKDKGYLWSKVDAEINNRKKGRPFDSVDFSTVEAFFKTFVSSDGERPFKTTLVPNDLMGDFYVLPLSDKIKVHVENDEMEKIKESIRAKKKSKEVEEEYDL